MITPIDNNLLCTTFTVTKAESKLLKVRINFETSRLFLFKLCPEKIVRFCSKKTPRCFDFSFKFLHQNQFVSVAFPHNFSIHLSEREIFSHVKFYSIIKILLA